LAEEADAMIPTRWRAAAAVLLLALAGCGKATGTLEGKVTLNGEPLSLGQVAAYHDNEVLAIATVMDGAYRLTDVPLGPVTLVVETYGHDGRPVVGAVGPATLPPGAKPLPAEQVKQMQQELPEGVRKGLESLKPVPPKYGSFQQSDLKATVVKGTTTYDIQMTGKGEIPKPPPLPPNVAGPSGVPPPIIPPR